MNYAMSAWAMRTLPRVRCETPPPPSSHLSSTASLALAARIHDHRVGSSPRPLRRFDTEADRQRRRVLVYIGTLFFIWGLILLFVGVGAQIPLARIVGLLLLGVGALLCIIKVCWSEVRAPVLPPRIVVLGPEEEPPLAAAESAAPPAADGQTPVSPPNSIPEIYRCSSGTAREEGPTFL